MWLSFFFLFITPMLAGTTDGTDTANQKYPVEGSVRLALQLRNGTMFDPKMTKPQQRDVFSRMKLKLSGNGLQMTAFVAYEGAFKFPFVPSGAYILEVFSPDFFFLPIRVDISQKLNGKVRAKPVMSDMPGNLPYPLVLIPISKLEYFEAPREFSIFNIINFILRNPMMWMFGVMGFLYWASNSLNNSEAMQELQAEGPRVVATKPEDLLTHFLKKSPPREATANKT